MSAIATPQTAVTTWNIDPIHSVAEFKVKHMMISNVKGQFTGMSGVLSLDESDVLQSAVETSIETASINTREPQRDSHLKSRDFLDVNRYPTITFQSTKVAPAGEHGYDVTGNLTIDWRAAGFC